MDSLEAGWDADSQSGHPRFKTPLDEAVFTALGSLDGKPRKPEPTLEYAQLLYIKERVEGDISEKPKSQRVNRVVGYLKHIVGEERILSELSHDDACPVRDYMLNELEMKPATVSRYLNDIKALVAFGLKELDLQDAYNPFLGLSVKSAL